MKANTSSTIMTLQAVEAGITKPFLSKYITAHHMEKAAHGMTDFEYPGIRMMIEAILERMLQAIKIDISTDDVITPRAVEYEYKLMFEDRTIPLLTYNLETLLAEKWNKFKAENYFVGELEWKEKDSLQKHWT